LSAKESRKDNKEPQHRQKKRRLGYHFPPMVKLGVAITAATVAILVAEFLYRRRRPFPLYGWLGLVALVCAEGLMFRGFEPVATYFTPIAWSAYILVGDAAVFAMVGRSRLRNAPQEFGQVALLSIPLWLIFEAYNLRLQNWTYTGVPMGWLASWFGYGWSFATIMPAIFETADVIESLGWFPPRPPANLGPRGSRTMMIAGVICLALPLALPPRIGSYLFGLVWIGFCFLLDPLNRRVGLPSLLSDLAEGRRGRLYSLLISGWVCGWLWEFWNYWAAAKWQYIFPFLQ
jgi:hypothetical protein